MTTWPALPRQPALWAALLIAAAVGLTLRIAAARGGLWLDEAWSAVFARDVGTPIGVFTGINHDNNHHLNTLWLQLVGIDAPPPVQRALSIASGTATVIVAGLVVARRGIVAAGTAAALFALSPIMVTYGSEARGYAPMLLILLLTVLAIDRWLEAPEGRAPVLGLSAAAVLGMFAQLTMVFGLAAVAGWVILRRGREGGPAAAVKDSVRALAVPLTAATATLLAIVWWLPPGGFQVGGYQSFHLADLAAGQSEMLGYTLGLSAGYSAAALGVAAGFGVLALLRLPAGRGWLYALAIAGIPLGIALAQIGNAAIPRYYLVGGAALLLLMAELLSVAVAQGGWRRLGALVVLTWLLAGGVWCDIRIIRNQRADPLPVISALQQAHPRGAAVSLDRERAAAVLEVAAAQRHYPINLADCAEYLFVDRNRDETFPARPTACGASYIPIAGATPVGLSGSAWRLYRRM